MDRPDPVPSPVGFVVKKGSNNFSLIAGTRKQSHYGIVRHERANDRSYQQATLATDSLEGPVSGPVKPYEDRSVDDAKPRPGWAPSAGKSSDDDGTHLPVLTDRSILSSRPEDTTRRSVIT
jgi:hypothetical protein